MFRSPKPRIAVRRTALCVARKSSGVSGVVPQAHPRIGPILGAGVSVREKEETAAKPVGNDRAKRVRFRRLREHAVSPTDGPHVVIARTDRICLG